MLLVHIYASTMWRNANFDIVNHLISVKQFDLTIFIVHWFLLIIFHCRILDDTVMTWRNGDHPFRSKDYLERQRYRGHLLVLQG